MYSRMSLSSLVPSHQRAKANWRLLSPADAITTSVQPHSVWAANHTTTAAAMASDHGVDPYGQARHTGADVWGREFGLVMGVVVIVAVVGLFVQEALFN